VLPYIKHIKMFFIEIKSKRILDIVERCKQEQHDKEVKDKEIEKNKFSPLFLTNFNSNFIHCIKIFIIFTKII